MTAVTIALATYQCLSETNASINCNSFNCLLYKTALTSTINIRGSDYTPASTLDR